jgi:hypothetical protein
MSFHTTRLAVLTGLAGAAVFSLGGAASAAGLQPPTLPGATGTGEVIACFSTPCQGDYSQSALQNATNISLSNFGNNYIISTVDDRVPFGAPTTFQTTVSTPGELTLPQTVAIPQSGGESIGGGPGSFETVTMNRSNPSVTFSGQSTGGDGGSGTLDYWFEVVNAASPASHVPVTIGLTASGSISGSTSNPNGYGNGNGADVQAELLIPFNLEQLAQAYYNYSDVSSPVYNNFGNTSNVTVNPGAASTFSGGFNIHNLPLTITTDTQYEIELNVNVEGIGYAWAVNASVDPMITTPVGYDLFLSPGISNAVPEPSTWAMMLLGFAGLGFAAHRRAGGNTAFLAAACRSKTADRRS